MLVLIIFSLIFQVSLCMTREIQQSRLIFDVTTQLNRVVDGKSSENELVSNLCSSFGLCLPLKTSKLFYSADGETLEELEKQTVRVCKIINDSTGANPGLQLLISWPVSSTILNALNFSPYNQTFGGFQPSIVLSLNDNINCNNLTTLTRWNKILRLHRGNDNTSIFHGIGINEKLVECNPIKYLMEHAKIVVVRMKHGKTPGVPESFGLFQVRLSFLSGNLINLSDKWWYGFSKQKLVYFPTPEYVGENFHKGLLATYADIWITSNHTNGYIIIQEFEPLQENLKRDNFSITPTAIHSSSKTFSNDFSWLSMMFATGFERPQSLVMNDRQWPRWSMELKSLYTGPKVPAFPLDIILDCSDFIPKSLFQRSRSWNFEEMMLEQTIAAGLVGNSNGKLSTIVFPITSETCKSSTRTGGCKHFNSPNKVKFANRMSSKLTIGCLLELESHETLKESDASTVVAVCDELKGNLYILKLTVILVWHNDVNSYSFYYEDTIRKELIAVNQLRNAILAKKPSARVYLQLKVEETDRPRYFNPINLINSLFCDEVSFDVIMYFEAIVNWAKLENFPVILNTDIRRRTGVDLYSAWFSLIRRLSYPYIEWWSDNRNYTQQETTRIHHLHPAFLMRSYLKSSFNWKMDECIDWKEGRTELHVDNFFDTHVGTIFRTEHGITKNGTEDTKTCTTMLQFIFHRFKLAEISFDNNFQNLMDALGVVLKLDIEYSTSLFLGYVTSELSPNLDLDKFKSFLTLMKETGITQKIDGVHLELVATLLEQSDSNGKIVYNVTNAKTVLKMLHLIKKTNLDSGVTVKNVGQCEYLIRSFISHPTDIIAECLRKASYLICIDDVSSQHLSISDLEIILDSHLFLHRLVNNLLPHLQLHFRVELEFELKRNRSVIQRYVDLLTLFKKFGTTYNINYFIVDAFDTKLSNRSRGWWGITNYDELSNPKSYVEKIPVYNGQAMWYPPFEEIPLTTTIFTGNPQLVVIVASASSAIVLLLVIIAVYIALRYFKLRRILSDDEVKEFMYGKIKTTTETPDNMEMQVVGSSEYMKFDQKYNLELSEIILEMDKILGSGAFGTVYKGRVKSIAAAIKLPINDCSKNTFKSFLSETKVLSYIGAHPNIVGFLGAYTKDIHKGVLYLATEFCSNGSLQGFLRKKANVVLEHENVYQNMDSGTTSVRLHELNRFSLEISKGMEYIESRRLVHGDLSARNVLLDENFVCKIGDFGLSRKLYEYQRYVKKSQEPLPWKWMAYESLVKMEFTPKSDVWSYGVTLWEIYSLGKIPYAGLNWSVAFADELEKGLRLPKPPFSSDETYHKMLECWSLSPDDRPNFADIYKFFQPMFEDAYTVL